MFGPSCANSNGTVAETKISYPVRFSHDFVAGSQRPRVCRIPVVLLISALLAAIRNSLKTTSDNFERWLIAYLLL